MSARLDAEQSHLSSARRNAPARQYARMRNLAIAAALTFVTVATGSLLVFQSYSERAVHDAILTQARAHALQFNAVRSYVQGFAGIYVPASDTIDINPHLEGISGVIPDIVRADGGRYVLQNSPIVAREVSRILEENTAEEPVRMSLYGLDPLNPANAPDAFASEAIERLQSGETEVHAFTAAGSTQLFRYALPIPCTGKCGGCHPTLVGRTDGIAGVSVVEMDVTRPLQYIAQSRAWVNLAIAAVIAASIIIVYLFVTRVLASMHATQRQLYEMVRRDALTGLFTRRIGMERLEDEVGRATRERHALACCVLDLDDFKRVNDELGHHVGDLALTAVGGAIRTRVRPYDIAARVGGEEFLVVMPRADEAEAEDIVARLREGIFDVTFQIPELGRALTCSAGIAILDPAHPETADALYIRADRALLEAKHAGKNRMVRDNARDTDQAARPGFARMHPEVF